jgi:hypothetical protein
MLTPCFAQDENPDSLPQNDTATKAAIHLADNEEDENDNDDTLYFLRKEDVNSIFDSSVFKWRAVPDSITQGLKNNADFWYADKDIQEKKEQQQSASWADDFFIWLAKILRNKSFRTFLWILIIVIFAAAVLWFLSKNQMNIWGASKGPAIARAQKQEGDIEDIFTADLKAEIEKAEQNNDYRLAIRFHYLHLLKMFSQRQLIKYTPDATNMEYLTQLYQKSYYTTFLKVTGNYEYAWYGKIAVTQQQYNSVVNQFMQLYNQTSVNP